VSSIRPQPCFDENPPGAPSKLCSGGHRAMRDRLLLAQARNRVPHISILRCGNGTATITGAPSKLCLGGMEVRPHHPRSPSPLLEASRTARSAENGTKCCYHHPQCPRTRIPLPTSSTTATTSPSSATTSPPPPSTLIYLDALQLPPGLQRPLRREGRRPLRLPDHRLQGHLGVDQKPPAPTMRRSLATPYWHLIRASIRLDPC
jgi:hypothetical protein